MFNKITKILVTLLFVLSFTSYANSQTIRIASVSGPSHHHNTALNWFADKINKQKNKSYSSNACWRSHV